MSRTDENYAKENNESSVVEGCGCFIIILAIGIALNIPAILNFIARMYGK